VNEEATLRQERAIKNVQEISKKLADAAMDSAKIAENQDMHLDSTETLSVKLSVGESHRPHCDQDSVLVDEVNQVFGVFDGMGGAGGDPREAADIARDVFSGMSHSLSTPDEVQKSMEHLLKAAHHQIMATAEYNSDERLCMTGGTTATVAKIIQHDNTQYLVWVSVADSRIYLDKEPKNASFIPEQLSADEGYGSTVTNCLGHSNDSYSGLSQKGIIEIEVGDRVILCTDGITGDLDKTIIEASELKKIMSHCDAAQDVADELVKCARKNDDRTVIVIDLK